jgi:hypothetical protein
MFVLGLVVLTTRSRRPGGEAPVPPAEVGAEQEERRVRDLFASGRSGETVTVQGRVDRLLADDDDGSRHQRFIVRLPSGHTLLVAHNIDLAPPVPLEVGDQVSIRGQYEWNDRGGILHWTHHDPDGDRPGGWIELRGNRYR